MAADGGCDRAAGERMAVASSIKGCGKGRGLRGGVGKGWVYTVEAEE